MNVQSYLEGGAANILKKASRFYLLDKNGRRFLSHFIPAAKSAAQKRKAASAAGGHIPPFLIASIATRCNLHCAGCYARANHAVGSGAPVHDEMTAGQWQSVFSQAAEMGISFILLAGGEPMMRMDVLEEAAKLPQIMFPVFTNGTMLEGANLDFMDKNRNLVPVLSIEGTEAETDSRRGVGVAAQVRTAARQLQKRKILFGASITVTSQNYREVTDPAYLGALAAAGCTAVVFVEYVPAEAGSEALVLDEAQNAEVEARVAALKGQYPDMVLLSFPGDERAMGGCLAAGRGFFHINAAGGAEPCPFSPYSDVSLKTHTLHDALESPLFTALRTGGILAKPHTGGCVLFEQEDAVRELAAAQP